jgi:superfamily I DNA/RNA helicase
LSEHDKLLALVRGESVGAEGYAERYQEERRLFYVALTRAKKKVYILYDEALKSDFVNEILPYGVVE